MLVAICRIIRVYQALEDLVGIISFVWLVVVSFGFWYLIPFVFFSTPFLLSLEEAVKE